MVAMVVMVKAFTLRFLSSPRMLMIILLQLLLRMLIRLPLLVLMLSLLFMLVLKMALPSSFRLVSLRLLKILVAIIRSMLTRLPLILKRLLLVVSLLTLRLSIRLQAPILLSANKSYALSKCGI